MWCEIVFNKDYVNCKFTEQPPEWRSIIGDETTIKIFYEKVS